MTMKSRLLIFGLCFITLSSCSINYYLCVTESEIPLYHSKKTKGTIVTYIPKGESVITKGKRKNRKIKYKDIIGWTYTPYFIKEDRYKYSGGFKQPEENLIITLIQTVQFMLKGIIEKMALM